jgi:AraC family transcriptional regulator
MRIMPLITTTDLPYRSKFGNDRVDSTPRRWAGALVQYNEWHSSEKEAWADLSCDQVNLVVILGRHGGTCGPRFSLKKPMLSDRNDPGFFFWIPANLTVYGFSQEARMIRELQVRFDTEQLMPILGDEIFGGKLHMPTPSIYDDRVAKCASMLADCCIDGQNEDRLFGECLITSLLAAAVQNITGKVSGSQVSGLVPWQLRIAKEYLHEHLVGDVSLEEVAGLTKLSLSRFARGFKASTGLPPYKWLLKERIQRAQVLMAATATPIADIATMVGFADQSHFTKAFRRVTGTTPRYWRTDKHN